MLTLQIHLTEPCLILPGAHLNEPLSAPPHNNLASHSSVESNVSSTAINLSKQRNPLANNLSPLSHRWSATEASHGSETGHASSASTAELSPEKTSMIRGFVVLHLSQAINLNRLSIKFSGTANTSGPDPAVVVPSCNNTILISEEYTVKDSALIPAPTNLGAPPYTDSSDPTTCFIPGLEAELDHSPFPPCQTPTEESQHTCSGEARAVSSKRNSTGISFYSHNLSHCGSTSQNPSPFMGERRRPRSHASARSSLSLASGVSRYFHRRSRSASPSGEHKTIPLEVNMQVSNSEEQFSSFVMVNKFPEDLAPMYQDSVFNMLANQYNLLAEEGSLLNDQPKSPSYEAHYHSLAAPEMIEDGYTRINLAADGFNQKETPPSVQADGVQSGEQIGKSKSFRSSIGHLFGALKLRRSSSSSSSSVGSGRDRSGHTSSNHRNLSRMLPESYRPHFLMGQTATKLNKGPSSAKKPENQARRHSNPSGHEKSAWVRYLPRRRSSGQNKSAKGIGIQNCKLNPPSTAGSCQHVTSKDPRLASEDPFRTSKNPSSGTAPVPEPSTTTTQLNPGVYKYPIVVPVPNHLPPSLTCDHGCISYALEAILTYEDVDDSTLMTTHQQIPIDLVDPAAGSPSLNTSCRTQLSGEEDVLNEVFSSYSGICIARSWEDQLYYQIRMDTRKFLVGGKIGFEIQFNPLSPVKIYKFLAEIEEKTQYFMDHEKTYLRHCDTRSYPLVKLEQTSSVVLINKETDGKFGATKLRASEVPLLPIIAADPVFVTRSPLLPYIKVIDSGDSDETPTSSHESKTISELSSWSEQSGPWNLKFDLRLPGCHSSCQPNATKGIPETDKNLETETKGLNFTCHHRKSPIVVKHFLKLRMRVERGDDSALDKRGRRKKYDIILSSPIQILSCRCKPYSLPAYAFSDPADMSQILSVFKQLNAAEENSAPSLQCNCIARVE